MSGWGVGVRDANRIWGQEKGMGMAVGSRDGGMVWGCVWEKGQDLRMGWGCGREDLEMGKGFRGDDGQ